MAPRPEVQNAADAEQVRGAGRRAARRRQRYYEAFRAVMETPAGRMVFGDREYGLLARAGVFRSVFNTHGGIQGTLIGRQDFGHEMMADLVTASEELYLLMETEMRALASRDASERDAAHTPRAAEGD